MKKIDPTNTETPTPEEPIVIPVEYKIISLDLIDDPERPMRTDLTPESVSDLILSIKQMGIIEPIIVCPRGERYEVIAGHRRRYAAELAKLMEVPCHVHNIKDDQVEMMKIHENLYRKDVRPSDEAQHFAHILKKFKISSTKLAQMINKSDSYISQRMSIFDWEPELKDAMDTGQIPFAVAIELSKTGSRDKTIEYLRYAIQNGLTAAGARQWVKDYKLSLETKPPETTQVYDPTGGVMIQKTYFPCIRCNDKKEIQDVTPVYICNPCLRDTVKEQNELHKESLHPAA